VRRINPDKWVPSRPGSPDSGVHIGFDFRIRFGMHALWGVHSEATLSGLRLLRGATSIVTDFMPADIELHCDRTGGSSPAGVRASTEVLHPRSVLMETARFGPYAVSRAQRGPPDGGAERRGQAVASSLKADVVPQYLGEDQAYIRDVSLLIC
jgi:hypothetical protein